MNKEEREKELINVYHDTESQFLSYPKPHSEKDSFLIKEIDYQYQNVKVLNKDCIDVAGELSKIGPTAILNMASFKRPGGGVKKGRMSQEEELCRRSNLMHGLSESDYPLALNEFIYTKGVTFFKNNKYEPIDPFTVDVITVAAIDLKEFPKEGIDSGKYKSVTKDKIETILREPAKRGVKNLVLSAFGCGVYKNDPIEIAVMFQMKIEKGYSKLYDNIIFAIFNDHNSVADNYTIFSNIIEKSY